MSNSSPRPGRPKAGTLKRRPVTLRGAVSDLNDELLEDESPSAPQPAITRDQVGTEVPPPTAALSPETAVAASPPAPPLPAAPGIPQSSAAEAQPAPAPVAPPVARRPPLPDATVPGPGAQVDAPTPLGEIRSAYPDPLTYEKLVDLVRHLDKVRRKGERAVTRQAVMAIAIEDLMNRVRTSPLDAHLETRLRGRKPAGTETRRIGFRLPQALDRAFYDLLTELNRPPRRKPQATLTRMAEIAVEDLLRPVDAANPPAGLVARLRAAKAG